MAYIEVKTTGPIEWARVFESNRDLEGYEGQYTPNEGAYTLNQVLDKDQFEKLKSAKSMKKPIQKRLIEGELVVKFQRLHKVTNRDGVEIKQAGGAPTVTDASGAAWDFENFGGLGNGTIAEVTNLVSTFKTSEGKEAARTTLVGLKVLEHVPVPERETA